MSKLVVIGGVNMDVHLFGPPIPEHDGDTKLVDHYLTQPGGKGANVSRAAARLGADVSLIARIGDDEYGHDCMSALVEDHVDVRSVVVTKGEPTGYVAIELLEGHHHSLVFAPGANDLLSWADIEPTIERLGAGDIVVVQAEIPVATMRQLVARTADNGVRLYVDPAPPDRMTADILRVAEVITPDRTEAAALVGRTDTSELWPPLAAAELRRLGAPCVIVKTGATGAVLAEQDQVVQVPTLQVEAIDETGAGDVFVAALAVRRAEGLDWDTAVRFANAASALSVAERGLLLPTRPDVDRAVAGLIEPTVQVL